MSEPITITSNHDSPTDNNTSEDINNPVNPSTDNQTPDTNPLTQQCMIRNALDQHGPALVRYAARILNGDIDTARDVVQDAFLKLCQADDRAQLQDHLTAWLYTVCRNRALDIKRKEQRMSTLSSEAQTIITATTTGSDNNKRVSATLSTTNTENRNNPTLAAAAHPETRNNVFQAIESLPTSQQDVLRLKFQSGLSYKQIARIMNESVTNVGFLIHIGLKTLREKLNINSPEMLSSSGGGRMGAGSAGRGAGGGGGGSLGITMPQPAVIPVIAASQQNVITKKSGNSSSNENQDVHNHPK